MNNTTRSSRFRPSQSTASRPGRREVLPGTKAFINGQRFLSTGLSQLDAILGGGYFLGSMTCIQSPLMAPFGSDLCRYFIAEGILSHQTTVVCGNTQTTESFLSNLPLELSSFRSTCDALAKVTLEDSRPSSSSHLNIAWQYEKYLANTHSSQSKRFCHSYNLAKPMQGHLLKANPPVRLAVELAKDTTTRYERLYQSIDDFLKEMENQKKHPRAMRLCLLHLGSPIEFGPWNELHRVALLKFLHRIKARVHALPIAVVIELTRDFLPESTLRFVGHQSDLVLRLECFVESQTRQAIRPEFQDLDGCATILKLPRLHSLACHQAGARMFGIKREKRKLSIEKLHLPPEESRFDELKLKRPSKGMGCSSSVAAGVSIDF